MIRLNCLILAAVVTALCFFQLPVPEARAQEPVPANKSVVVPQEQMFFAGATEDDKAFIRAMRKAIDASDKGRWEKRRAHRLLDRQRFVERAKAECALELWADGTLTEDGELIVGGLIDWEKLDIEKLTQLVDVLMKLIEFISELFAAMPNVETIVVCWHGYRLEFHRGPVPA